jgi:toxin ParE1/3/4
MARIVRTALARADLRDIWLYIAQDSINAADRFLDRIDHTVRLLADNPGLGEPQEHLKQGLRRFVVGTYLIFYEPIPDGIRVVRVLHGARRWEDMFD